MFDTIKNRECLTKLVNADISCFCIFCAGNYGRELYRILKLLSIDIDYFSDNNKDIWNTKIVDNIVCIPVGEIQKENTMMIVANKTSADIINDLKTKGFPHIITKQQVERAFEQQLDEIINKYAPNLVSYMAFSGKGSDACLEQECLPVPIHFYQPIPDLKHLEKRNAWNKISQLKGIKWEPQKYLDYLKALSEYQMECDWPNETSDNPMQFYLNNNSFSYTCAAVLYCTIRKLKPKRIIEIGSGNSSKVIASAITKNAEKYHCAEYTIIDPYSGIDASLYPKKTKLLRMPVEETEESIFEQLSENDILFIDSSHVSKIASDVNFEILEILPLLKKGVIVHFHDIPMPYEYPKIYSTNPNFRMFWNESYLLQAFLSGNGSYEILAPLHWMCREHESYLRELFPNINKTANWSSGSFWIRRK